MSLIHQLLFWGVYAIQAPSGLAAWPRDILAVPTVYHGDNWAIPLMVQGGSLDIWLIDHGHADRPSAGTSGKVQNWRLSLQFLYDGMRRSP